MSKKIENTYLVKFKVRNDNDVNEEWSNTLTSHLELNDFKVKIKKQYPKARNIRVIKI